MCDLLDIGLAVTSSDQYFRQLLKVGDGVDLNRALFASESAVEIGSDTHVI
jgi:hypothetical protein